MTAQIKHCSAKKQKQNNKKDYILHTKIVDSVLISFARDVRRQVARGNRLLRRCEVNYGSRAVDHSMKLANTIRWCTHPPPLCRLSPLCLVRFPGQLFHTVYCILYVMSGTDSSRLSMGQTDSLSLSLSLPPPPPASSGSNCVRS